MNPKQMEAAQKIVMAGMKILYAPQTRQLLNKAIENMTSQDPQRLAVNVVGIIKMIYDKSGGKMPPGAIPMATVLLMYELATFASEATGEKIPAEVIQKAVPIAMELLKKTFAKQIESAKQGGQQPAPAAPPPPQAGLINQQPQMVA